MEKDQKFSNEKKNLIQTFLVSIKNQETVEPF